VHPNSSRTASAAAPLPTRDDKDFHLGWDKGRATSALPSVLFEQDADQFVNVGTGEQTHTKHLHDAVDTCKQVLGINDDLDLKEADVFMHFLGDGYDLLLKWATQDMRRRRGISPLRDEEFKEFIGILFWVMLCQLPKAESFELLQLKLTNDGWDGKLMTTVRFTQIQNSLLEAEPAVVTSRSHTDMSNRPRRIQSLDNALWAEALKAVASSAAVITIDDRNVGTRSSQNQVNTWRPRKRHTNGAGSDCAADARYRIIAGEVMYGNGYKQSAALAEILEMLTQTQQDNGHAGSTDCPCSFAWTVGTPSQASTAC